MYILKSWFEWHHSESHSVHTSRRATSNPRSPPFSTNCACQPFDPFAYCAFWAFWYWFRSTIILKKSSFHRLYPFFSFLFLINLLVIFWSNLQTQCFYGPTWAPLKSKASSSPIGVSLSWQSVLSTANEQTWSICRCSFHHHLLHHDSKTGSLLIKIQAWTGKSVGAPQSSATQGFQEL